MRQILFIVVFTCAYASACAQVNYVKNPSFEDTVKCPDEINEIGRAKYWHCAVDTAGNVDGYQFYAPEYYNSCAGTTAPVRCAVPDNTTSYQYPRTGNTYIGGLWYYDQTLPFPPFVSPTWRDYAQGHLIKPLQAGKSYCVSFWVVMAETSGYGIKNLGAYLDNGNINKRSPAGEMITDVMPQVYSKHIIMDTLNWTKIEGSFMAKGNETHITVGNFAKQADVDTQSVLYFVSLNQYSYYLIDDISVVESDLPADAGKDNWVAVAKTVQVGRVGDTTAEAIDCKWYHKGSLIDSGAIITVKANAVAGTIDTYVVVQTICGLVKSDTALIKTVGLGMQETDFENAFTVYPNPAKGFVYIHSATEINGTVAATIYDLSGRVLFSRQIAFDNKQATLNPNLPGGTYFLAITDEAGRVERARIVMLE